MKKALLALSLLATAIPAAPVFADPPPWAPAHGRRAHDWNRDHDDDDRGYDRDYRRDYRYDRYGRYAEPVPLRRSDHIWRGDDGRYYCRRNNGTTGLIIGAGVGALLGRSLDRGRDRAVGTILGAAGGALLGREIDRGSLRCR